MSEAVRDETEAARLGLPGPLPPGERILWAGKPERHAIARHVFHVRLVALYFAILALWAVGQSLVAGASLPAALLNVVVPLPLALPVLGLLIGAAWLTARTTTYIVTDRRVILLIGVAITKMVNIPLRQIVRAEARDRADGTQDIALTLKGPVKVAWLALFPHVRAWRIAQPTPMLRSLGVDEPVADVLTTALMRAAPGIRYGQAAPVRGQGAAAPTGARAQHA